MNLLARFNPFKPGEARKTFLLYGMHFVFYLGLRWGENANEAMFLEYWSSKDLGAMFIGGSILAFVVGLAYTAYADRVDNEKLLLAVLAIMVAWLVSVRILLVTNGGMGGWVYPYYYLVYDGLNGLATLHILTYINDFYDTRAAKRALPLMLSAGIIASAVAGFNGSLLEDWIGLENIPLAWIVCIIIVALFVFLNSRYLSGDISATQQKAASKAQAATQTNILQNLKTGFAYVNGSGLLRWLGISTFLMLFILKLLTYHAGTFFQEAFAGQPNLRFAFFANMDGIGYTLAFLIQVFLFNRLLSRFGVGAMTVAYPAFTFLSLTSLVYAPNWVTSIFGRLNVSIFKRALRNPLDAMLYNGVPLSVKGRAKGFINAVLVAFGTLFAGLLLLFLKQGWLSTSFVDLLGLVAVVIFVISAFKLRENYTLSLTSLLKENTLNIFDLANDEWQEPDPAAIQMLYKRMNEAGDDAVAVFLAEMIYETQGDKSLPFLLQHARTGTPIVRASIIQLLGHEFVALPEFQQLCQAGMSDPSGDVRAACAATLAKKADVEHDQTALDAFYSRLADDDPRVLAAIIPPLISSGDFHYLAPAVQQLSMWLGNSNDALQRRLGLQVLVQVKNERLIQTLVRYLKDDDPLVRQCAVGLIDDISAEATSKEVKAQGMQILQALLKDEDPSVRIVAVQGLTHFKNIAASRILLEALADDNFAIRRQVCAGLNPLPRKELIALRETGTPLQVECACYVLAASGYTPARRQIPAVLEDLLRRIYTIYALEAPLLPYSLPASMLLRSTLREQVEHLLARIFWLCEPLSTEQDILMIQRALKSQEHLTLSNALETLDSLTSPLVAHLLAPIYDNSGSEKRLELGRESLGIASFTSLSAVYEQFWPEFGKDATPTITTIFERSTLEWLQAVAILSVIEQMIQRNAGDVSRVAVMVAMVNTEKNTSPLVQESLKYASARLLTYAETLPLERPMLTLIEKVIFLKEVHFFKEFSIEQLRILASICEEKRVAADETIFAAGDEEDALYIVVNGRIALQRKIQRKISRIAEFSTRQYFAEMSIFDAKAHNADAIAIEASILLLVRPAPLAALVETYPALATKLLKVLSQRLRDANDALAQKVEAKPASLVGIFDKLG